MDHSRGAVNTGCHTISGVIHTDVVGKIKIDAINKFYSEMKLERADPKIGSRINS